MASVGVYVSASAIFPEVATDFATFCSLVRSLSRNDTLFWCARLNLILSNPEKDNDHAKQQYGTGLFLDDEEIERLNRFVSEHGQASKVALFLRAQLLELMRWACLLAQDLPGDGETFEDPNVRRRFLQAALMASDIWGTRTYEGRILSTGNVVADRRHAMAAFRQGVASNASALELMRMLARGISIYREAFHHGYRDADAEFFAATGLTLDQYMACLYTITIHFARVDPESAEKNPGGFRLDAIKTGLSVEMALAMDLYIQLESQTADDLRASLWNSRTDGHGLTGAEAFDPKALRERPVFRTADGRAIILDPAYYSEKASVGPLFTLVKALGKSNKAITVFGAFGSAFEAYVNSILRTMYPSPSSLLPDRLTCNLHGRMADGADVEIADACLNDVSEVVLFETKGVFLPDAAAQGANIETYLTALRKKYGVTVGGVNDRGVKGVGQLARSIRRIASKELVPAGLGWEQVRYVFPVLVVYDVSLGAPGHAEFFEQEFAQALEPDDVVSSGYMRKGSLTVAPLTVMTVDDLENLESSVQHFRLVDFLRDYAGTVRAGVRLSLHDFMASSQKKYKFTPSSELADRAIKVLEETGRMMFPGITFSDERQASDDVASDDVEGAAKPPST